MKAFTKNYIGKGKQNPNFDIVKMTLKVDDYQKFIFEKEGVKYLTFEVAKMREADQFGRTHTAYIVSQVETASTFEKPKAWTTDEIFATAVERKLITNSGSWYSFKDRKIGHGKNLTLRNINDNLALRHEMIKTLTEEIPF